jgi:hypothetical protein
MTAIIYIVLLVDINIIAYNLYLHVLPRQLLCFEENLTQVCHISSIRVKLQKTSSLLLRLHYFVFCIVEWHQVNCRQSGIEYDCHCNIVFYWSHIQKPVDSSCNQ